jgi:hypothetical protein
MVHKSLTNPFKPGAGHMPPYLAGREKERIEFEKLLQQKVILKNLVLTGLRGVGKTVLLDTFKPLAMDRGWNWIGTDLSESASLSEDNIATRLLADLSVVTSSIVVGTEPVKGLGFSSGSVGRDVVLDYPSLVALFESTPGLIADKLKHVLETVWEVLKGKNSSGLIFAYDEAQNLSDHADKDTFPLSLLLDIFQSIQKKGIPFMLVLTGLPTLFPKLVEARTFAERMFQIMFLDKLDRKSSREAILKPIEDDGNNPVTFEDESVEKISEISGGYPYFIQFICREVFDFILLQPEAMDNYRIPMDGIVRRLDADFFYGRWSRATDRQRELLFLIAALPNAESEFTVSEIVEQSKASKGKPFGNSHVNQLLTSLSTAGLVYKNRHGKYSFAVPMLSRFIQRQMKP